MVSVEEISFLICEYRGRNSAFGYLLCSCTGRGGYKSLYPDVFRTASPIVFLRPRKIKIVCM
nr:MAG TPA: NF-kappa-B-activating protein [Caudoviricetes sp.]